MMKKLITYSLTALATLVLVFSCTKNKVVELTVSPLAVNYEVAGGEQSVSITCNDAWKVSCSAEWLTLSATSGDGNGTLKITAAENKSVDRRETEVKFTAGEVQQVVKVSQLGLTPELLVTPTSLVAGDEGKSFILDITSNIPWTITIPAEALWLGVDKTSGEGSANVTVVVDPNTTVEDRSTEIVVAGGKFSHKIAVSQAGQPMVLSVDVTKINTEYEGGEIPVQVTSNVPWTVSILEESDWVSVNPASGENDGTVIVTVDRNIYRTDRSATVYITAAEELSVSIPVFQDVAPASRQTDSLALVALYEAFGGAAAMKEDRVWDLTKAMDDPEAKWYGVTLTNNRVTALKFLKGTVTADWTIPAEIADLEELTDLRFVDCKVNGDIPEEIYTLSKLSSLYLTNNKVTGTLSPKIGDLTELTNIYIDQNPNLGGTLPEEIGNLSKLVNLNIAKTAFSGSIPSSVTNLDALKNFMAYSTQFSGNAPDFWDQLASLELVQLYDIPTLTGPLPASFGSCAKLKNIYMYDCNFEGNIPESWANLPSTMVNVRVHGNKLKGVVPAAVQAHAKWSAWKPEQYIFPQQEGYGLTDKEGSGGQDLDGGTEVDPWN